jgi:hypothetical protein
VNSSPVLNRCDNQFPKRQTAEYFYNSKRKKSYYHEKNDHPVAVHRSLFRFQVSAIARQIQYPGGLASTAGHPDAIVRHWPAPGKKIAPGENQFTIHSNYINQTLHN